MLQNFHHTLDNQQIHYLQWGEKSADTYFVYFHATGLNSRAYQDILSDLHNQLPGMCILAFDQRGHGQSQTIQTIDKWDEVAEEYAEILNNYSDKKIILCGHSFGGAVALKLSGQVQQVEKIILLDPVLQTFRSNLYKRFAYWKRHIKNAKWESKIFVAFKAAIIYDKFDNELANFTRKRRTTFPSIQAAKKSYTNKGLFIGWTDSSLQNYLLGGTKKTQTNDAIELTCTPEFEAKIYSTSMSNVKRDIKHLTIPTAVLYAERASTISKGALKLLKNNPMTDLYRVKNGVHMFPFVQPEDAVKWICNFVNYEQITIN